jgi:hypothetical protein
MSFATRLILFFALLTVLARRRSVSRNPRFERRAADKFAV